MNLHLKMFRSIFMVFLLWEGVTAVIYKLNETEYNAMPALYGLDNYHRCLLERGAMYCVIDIELFSTKDSALMRTIEEYSADTIKHFNHKQIHRGVCVNTTCSKFIQNNTGDLSKTLEVCLNASLWESYNIESKLSKIQYCKTEEKNTEFDISDLIMIVVYVLIIAFNIVGSLYDIFVCENNAIRGNALLLSFSVRRNWAKLTASSDNGTDPKVERLRAFYGLRTITMICVIFSHTALVLAYTYVENPLYVETTYNDLSKQILFNGTVVTCTFFAISSFLMAYNFEIHREKHKVTWVSWPKGILYRWLRLTPTYALVLATISTVMRHLGDGPLWDYIVSSESQACRQYWWSHIFYFNNYIHDDAFCFEQSWYLAADTQLFCLGLLLCILPRRYNIRIVALVCLFVISFMSTAAQTYLGDLNAVITQSPENFRSLYLNDKTFRLIYISGHNNLSAYILGLAGGLLAYHWQKEHKTFNQYKNYRWLIWLIVPINIGVILSGGLFYVDGWMPPIGLRVVYATFYKLIFQFLIVILIISCVFKFEDLYRGVLEWRGFTWTGRVTYSAYLQHSIYQRAFIGIQATPILINDYFLTVFLAAMVFVTYISAAGLWLCVEAPVTGLIKASFATATEKKSDVEISKT